MPDSPPRHSDPTRRLDATRGGDTTAVGDEESGPRDSPERRPDQIGRYSVVAKLGEGGMGVVYAGYDLELDRTVAIKLLTGAQGKQRRLVREAQALAKLNHPNVVQIYDVGLHEGRVFLAMEFVRGKSLADWLLDDTREWDEIIELFLQAGRGLAAAHRAGVVHRDFKPDNVMVGDDGRVRVLDFGLAAATELEEADPTSSIETAIKQATAERSALTDATVGVLMGTPAYMSPEQWRCEPCDARSDQFSFCVALYEALYQERPFKGDTTATLCTHVLEDEVSAPKDPGAVPSRIRRVLLRGLSKQPADRYPDTAELLEALSPRARAPRTWAIAAGAGLLGMSLAVGLVMARDRERPDRCAGTGEVAFAEVYSDSTRDRLASAFEQSGAAIASDTWDRVDGKLSAYAERWAAAYDGYCRSGVVPTPRRTAVRSCLDDRKQEFAFLVEELEGVDRQDLPQSVSAASSLPRPENCREVSRSDEGSTATIADRHEASRLLSKARVSRDLGHYDEALGFTDELDALGVEQWWPSRYAESLHQRGRSEIRLGQLAEARDHLRQSFFVAQTAGRDDLVAAAAADLAYVVGPQSAEYEAGLAWIEHGQAALERSNPRNPALVNPLAATNLANTTGLILRFQQDYDGSLEAYQRAEQLAETHHLTFETMASIRNNVGLLLRKMGRPDEAVAALESVRDSFKAELGPRHPKVGLALINLGIVLGENHDVEGSSASYLEAIELWESVMGPDYPDLALAYNNLGTAYFDTGDYEQAHAYFKKADDLLVRSHGEDFRGRAKHLHNLGETKLLLDDPERGLELLEAALAIDTEVFGDDHPELSWSLGVMASAHLALDNPRAALEASDRAMAITEGRDDYRELRASLRVHRARAHLALGHTHAARADALRAALAYGEAVTEPAQRERGELDIVLRAVDLPLLARRAPAP